MSAAAQQKVRAIINENPVAIFSKSYCPHCRASKATLAEAGATPFVVELDKVDDGADLQAALKAINGQSTVPNIYINKEHIGGNSDLQGAKSQLPGLLEAAGAI